MKRYTDHAANILKKKCKKKTNKLVYTDYPQIPRGKCHPVYVPKITKQVGTRIRYCTAKELKLMAGRRMCECPPATRAFELRSFLMNIMKTAAKAAALFGVAYVTYDLGFWGTPKDTQATFAGICEAMPCRIDPCKPYEFLPRSRECEEELELLKVSPYDPCACENPIPVDMERCCYKAKQLWNHTVINIFDGIVNAPDNFLNYFARKWAEFMDKDCGTCKTRVIEETYAKSGKCELIDDYDEKFEKEEIEDDECKWIQEESMKYLDETDEEEETGEPPRCGI